MLKQITGALVILAGVGFIFNSCSQDEPTFEDPCPRDTCDELGVEEPPDSLQNPGGGDSSSNPSSGKTYDLAMIINVKTPGNKDYDVKGEDVNVTISANNTEIAQGNPEEASLQNCFGDDNKVYFNQTGNHFNTNTPYRVDVDTFQFTYYGENDTVTNSWYKDGGLVTIQAASCESYALKEIQLDKVE